LYVIYNSYDEHASFLWTMNVDNVTCLCAS
jgi:hypothetical protein